MSVGAGSELQPITREQFCVTNGAVLAREDEWLSIETASSRAVVPGATEPRAEIRFRYLGPSGTSKPLASGELRRQIGLKLKAVDGCNLIYAMWHIEPDFALAVSVKRNPGMQTHAQCGARGYVSLKAEKMKSLRRPQAGEVHTLRAELRGDRLTLIADGVVAWEGSAGPGVAELAGPVGLRTDNARFEIQFLAALGNPTRSTAANNPCVHSPAD
jgi:hypothetical protein